MQTFSNGGNASSRHFLRQAAAASVASLLAVAICVGFWLYTGSATLAVFWAITALYAIRMVGAIDFGEPAWVTSRKGPSMARRTAIAVLSAGAAIGILALAVPTFGRAWTVIAVALCVGLGVHIVAGLTLAPMLIRRQLRLGEPRQVMWGPDDIAPRPAVVVGAIGMLVAVVLGQLGSIGWVITAGVVGMVSIALVMAGAAELRRRGAGPRSTQP